MEIWKKINDYEDYEISNFGNIKSSSRLVKNKHSYRFVKETMLKPTKRKDGYYCVNIRRNGKHKNFLIHQLMAIVFLNHKPNGLNIVVDHINGKKYENNLENLQIITQRENIAKAERKKTSKYVGVFWNNGVERWQSGITFKNKYKYLGYFKCETSAYIKYLKELKNI